MKPEKVAIKNVEIEKEELIPPVYKDLHEDPPSGMEWPFVVNVKENFEVTIHSAQGVVEKLVGMCK